jgi:hypothetical protein
MRWGEEKNCGEKGRTAGKGNRERGRTTGKEEGKGERE